MITIYWTKLLIQIIRTNKIVRSALLILFTSVFVFGGFVAQGYALPPEQKRIFDSGIRYFDIEGLDCGPGANASLAGIEGAEALQKQADLGELDQQWVDIIIKEAEAAEIHPVMLATLLYVENGGNWPEYKATGWHYEPGNGSGPWAIGSVAWPASAGPYNEQTTGDPVTSTPVSAGILKAHGAEKNMTIGSIEDDHGKDGPVNTVAAQARRYNGGIGTYRIPGQGSYKDNTSVWHPYEGNEFKQTVLDNYIVISQYAFYHISVGKPIPPQKDNNVRADAAWAMIEEIESLNTSSMYKSRSNVVAQAPPEETENTETNEQTGPEPEAIGEAADQAVVALDPGHGAVVDEYKDPVTGLYDRETSNSPEREDAQDVAGRVKSGLEQAGYKVVMLKETADGKVSKRERVDKAKQAGADLGISIHTTPGELNEVWPQRVGTYRENISDGTRVTFDNAEVAEQSEKIAEAMAAARSASEGHPVDTDPDQSTQTGSLSRPGLPATGNLSIIQLMANDFPWVYNEIEQDGPGASITEERKEKYAEGIIEGVKNSLPTTGGSNTSSACGGNEFGGGGVEGLISTVVAYAWPEYHSKPFLERKPEYIAAVEAAKAQSPPQYIGDYCHGGGIDCGGFVTRAMVDSGYEPRYNYDGLQGNSPDARVTAGNNKKPSSGTAYQQTWAEDNWEALGEIRDTAELRPGDAAFQYGHTFLFVGDVPNFEGPWASSSRCSRAPMAGQGGEWNGTRFFRKKSG